jgi:predicted porin
MKHIQLKALPLALALALTCGASNAEPSVTVYGDINVGLVSSNFKATGQTPIQGTNSALSNGFQMLDNSSLWGVRGKEDLGGGLYAGFSLEGGLNVNNGTGGQDFKTQGRIFGRDAEIKLGGDFGEVYAGYVLSPAGLQLLLAADPWYWNGNQAGMGWTIQQANYTQTNYLRTPGTIGYRSPNVNGFSAQLSYSPADKSNVYGTSSDAGGAFTYRNGPLLLGVGFDRSHSLFNDVPQDSMWDIVGGYDFGVVHPSFSYTKSSVNDVSYSSYVLALTAPVGASGLFKAAYGHLSDCTCNSSKSALFRASVGYQHNLSKRTNVYVNLSQSKAEGLSSANTLELGMEHGF